VPRPTRPGLTAAEVEIRALLARRGLRWNGERDPTPLLVPRPRRAQARHYALLAHYSYRLFLRDLIRRRTDLRAAALTRYVTAAVAGRYLRALAGFGLLDAAGHGRWRLHEPRVVSFGGTLEWYVAELLAREFGCAATYGLRIPGAPHGGDYDVVASAEGEAVYLETKSAPPRQIVQGEIGAFLDRIDTLRPDLALFLADTTLRMRDKLVPLFADESTRRGLGWTAERLERETWRVGPEVYLLNAEPDLTRSIGRCLAAHFRARGIAVPAPRGSSPPPSRSRSA
jgi:hypothetical protein